MNFKDLREANLSKAQINKVHDKADDLPKSDFIKRYGKEGDAVRFATATNIIKKQLGIDEAIKGNDFVGVSSSSNEYKQGKQAAKDGKKYDDNPYKSGNREMNIKRLNWSSGHNNFREELDKEDEKSIGDVIKGLKKAVKSHQGQVKSLTKDIQDEVTNEGGPGSGPQHGEITITKNGKSKKVKRPALSIFKKAGWKQEEVVTEAVSAAQVNQIQRMTDRNNHFGVRIELARIAGDKELMQHYASLEKMHSKLGGVIGNSALEVRQKLESVLKNRLQRKFNDKDADRLMGAL